AQAADAGRGGPVVRRVLSSTDDPEIAETARAAGADVPFLRPAELAADNSEDWAVFMHALAFLDTHEGWRPDLIVNLRPTSPLRTPTHVDDAIRLLLDTGADSVKAVCLARQHPLKMWLRPHDGSFESYLEKHFII